MDVFCLGGTRDGSIDLRETKLFIPGSGKCTLVLCIAVYLLRDILVVNIKRYTTALRSPNFSEKRHL